MMRPNQKKYNSTYYQKRRHLAGHLAYPLAAFLKSKGVKMVLDVGCGSGELLRFLQKKGFKTTGVDSSQTAVKLSGAIKAKATKLPFKNKTYDAILAISLIEHLGQKGGQEFLKEAHRVLKRDGLIFLVTPNLWSPLKFVSGQKWFAHQDPTHLFFYSPLSLLQLCQKNDFAQIKFFFRVPPKTPFDWPLPKIFQRFPKWLKRVFNLLLISTPFSLCRDSFWLAAQKNAK